MGALFAAVMFALFVMVDYLLHRKTAEQPALTTAAIPESVLPALEPALEPVWVGGYQLPQNLHYHRGHTWVRPAGDGTVAVGIDDFAGKLLGTVTDAKLPQPGAWLVQGGKAAGLEHSDRKAELVAPVEGEVVQVNPALRQNPELCATDPYGRGWLFKIRPSNLAANLRNLLNGTLAQRWTEDARDQLELELMALSGSVLRDGGELSRDFPLHLEPEAWKRLVGRFLLT